MPSLLGPCESAPARRAFFRPHLKNDLPGVRFFARPDRPSDLPTAMGPATSDLIPKAMFKNFEAAQLEEQSLERIGRILKEVYRQAVRFGKTFEGTDLALSDILKPLTTDDYQLSRARDHFISGSHGRDGYYGRALLTHLLTLIKLSLSPTATFEYFKDCNTASACLSQLNSPRIFAQMLGLKDPEVETFVFTFNQISQKVFNERPAFKDRPGPTTLVMDPKHQRLLPEEFYAGPSAFIEKLEPNESGKVVFKRIVPADQAGLAAEIDLTNRVAARIRAFNIRYVKVQEFLGLVEDRGNFYQLSRKVEDKVNLVDLNPFVIMEKYLSTLNRHDLSALEVYNDVRKIFNRLKVDLAELVPNLTGFNVLFRLLPNGKPQLTLVDLAS
jgi:hypothetical protein